MVLSVEPSGRFSSCLLNPYGSLTAGMPADLNVRQMMSLITLCLSVLPGSFLQAKA